MQNTVFVTSVLNGSDNSLIPCLRRSCIDEITIKRNATEQARRSQFGKNISLNGMPTLRHPVEDVVVEDVRTGVDEF